jgi:PhnB protein
VVQARRKRLNSAGYKNADLTFKISAAFPQHEYAQMTRVTEVQPSSAKENVMSKAVSYIPAGFHTATPYLIVNDGARALEFYKQAFNATIINCDATPDGKFMNAEICIGTSPVMIGQHAEVIPKDEALPPVSLYLYVEDAAAFATQALAAGATEISPVSDKFYGNREGGVRDPFGITWWIATRIEDLTPEEIAERAANYFGAQENPAA